MENHKMFGGFSIKKDTQPACNPFPKAHLEDAIEVPFVHPQEVAAVFTEDDGGCPGGIIHQCQLSKVIALMQGRH